MAEMNGPTLEPQRKPFTDDARIKAWKLCAKSAIRIDTLKGDLDEEKKRFEKLKDAIRAGGYLIEDQGQLPLEESDDAQRAQV